MAGKATTGIVEADETYFGKVTGQGKGHHGSKKQKVVALVERQGRVRAFHVASIAADSIKPILEGAMFVDSRALISETIAHLETLVGILNESGDTKSSSGPQCLSPEEPPRQLVCENCED